MKFRFPGFGGKEPEPAEKKFTYLRLGQPLKLGRLTLMPGTRLAVLNTERRNRVIEYECFMGSDWPTFFVGFNSRNKIEQEISTEPKIELVVK
jgi:hypothetical protein